MKAGIAKEHREGERRVAVSPETVKKLLGLKFEVAVETGAGARAFFNDDHYAQAGAHIAKDKREALEGADVILTVRPPGEAHLAHAKQGACVVGLLDAYGGAIQQYVSAGVTAFAMELMPRITRAQSMDVLSSQANLAGYKSVLDATEHYARMIPLMMTAAGTVAPARVFVMGVGVAGLQAIATARRLGAIVSATDVRAVAQEQVESLGGSFVMVEEDAADDSGETAGGYAKEMSEDYQRRQAALVAEHIAKQDIVITTALIPGRPAPVLVSEDMVHSMKPGSVIVDLAVEQGGNCALTQADTVTEVGGVTIIGHSNVAGRLASDASALYAKNVFNFLEFIVNQEAGALEIDWEDEIITATALTHDGSAIHPMFSDTKQEDA
ncbi:MAG: Re/Si-specific NAD(P)(+) transhydrogenase subunit alpha [Parvularculales bacterium]